VPTQSLLSEKAGAKGDM